jgi:hypothetical protein
MLWKFVYQLQKVKDFYTMRSQDKSHSFPRYGYLTQFYVHTYGFSGKKNGVSTQQDQVRQSEGWYILYLVCLEISANKTHMENITLHV